MAAHVNSLEKRHDEWSAKARSDMMKWTKYLVERAKREKEYAVREKKLAGEIEAYKATIQVQEVRISKLAEENKNLLAENNNLTRENARICEENASLKKEWGELQGLLHNHLSDAIPETPDKEEEFKENVDSKSEESKHQVHRKLQEDFLAIRSQLGRLCTVENIQEADAASAVCIQKIVRGYLERQKQVYCLKRLYKEKYGRKPSGCKANDSSWLIRQLLKL